MVTLHGWKFPLTHFPIVSRSNLDTCPNRRRGKDKIRKFWPQPKIGDLLTSDDLPMWFNCIMWSLEGFITHILSGELLWHNDSKQSYSKLSFPYSQNLLHFLLGTQVFRVKMTKATRYGRLSPHFIIYIHRPIKKSIWAFVPPGGTNFWKCGLWPMDYYTY